MVWSSFQACCFIKVCLAVTVKVQWSHVSTWIETSNLKVLKKYFIYKTGKIRNDYQLYNPNIHLPTDLQYMYKALKEG